MTADPDWPRRGRWWLAAGQAAGLATIVLAGRASAHHAAAGGQGRWVAIAITAALLSAGGNGVWLAVLRRAATTRRRTVVARIDERADRGCRAGPPPRPIDNSAGRWVMVPGLTRRHRPDCALVAGRAVVPATADARSCGWCES